MRRFSFIFVTVSIVLLIVLSIQAERMPKDKLLFKQTLYSQLTTDETLIVDGYTNQANLFVDIAAIESLYVSSLDEHFKLIPTLMSIEKGGKYRYLGDQYTKYRYILKLPKLEVDYYIKDCYMTILLKNGTHIQVSIGRLSLMKPSILTSLTVVNQFGKNNEGSAYLGSISLDIMVDQVVTIQTICNSVSQCSPIDTVITDQKTIHLNLPTDAFYYNQTPLRINYLIGGTEYSETLDTFRYFEQLSTEIPENSQNRVYVLN